MNKKIKIALFGLAFILSIPRIFAKSNTTKFFPVNTDNLFRLCDSFGCGNYGASRGEREHNGIDFKVIENQEIKAPFDCEIVRFGYPYSDDNTQQLLQIQGLNSFSKYTAKMMYIKPTHPIGTVVNRGLTICLAGNISNKFGDAMTNHVHFELYENGNLINPEPFFRESGKTI